MLEKLLSYLDNLLNRELISMWLYLSYCNCPRFFNSLQGILYDYEISLLLWYSDIEHVHDNVNCVDIGFLCIDKNKLLERNYVHLVCASHITSSPVPEAVVVDVHNAVWERTSHMRSEW